ncbi:MAG: STAS/SEC14 domain-containing protein [Bdellovibrionales bacterium]|nr:STAS/SEC14 domain-containing protein [Bdellovibrionales bacterium]
MLETIKDLPKGVVGVRASGQVSKSDYETVMKPLLEEHHRMDQNICFLYHLGPSFQGFTVGAAWDDFYLGMKYLKLFEKCAVVTNVEWVVKGTQLMSHFMPCPVRTYKNEELQNAVSWLQEKAVPRA